MIWGYEKTTKYLGPSMVLIKLKPKIYQNYANLVNTLFGKLTIFLRFYFMYVCKIVCKIHKNTIKCIMWYKRQFTRLVSEMPILKSELFAFYGGSNSFLVWYILFMQVHEIILMLHNSSAGKGKLNPMQMYIFIRSERSFHMIKLLSHSIWAMNCIISCLMIWYAVQFMMRWNKSSILLVLHIGHILSSLGTTWFASASDMVDLMRSRTMMLHCLFRDGLFCPSCHQIICC